MDTTQFYDELLKHNIELTHTQKTQFHTYYQVLVEWNKKMNLTSITEQNDVYLKHFYDSIIPFITWNTSLEKNAKICDVGAGAGFPSIPLKIIRPDLDITIIDSLGKRIHFLKYLVKELNLAKVNPIHARAEEYAATHREYFDYVTARAVARLNLLSELCLPLVKVGGSFIALKGQTGIKELQEANNAITKLGASVQEKITIELPHEAGTRHIIILDKTKNTPSKYPRNFGQIKKKPIR